MQQTFIWIVEKASVRVIGLAVLLVLTACAYSPQQVEISPAPLVNAESYGQGKSVAVKVEDRRENKVLGSRGGVYKDTSLVTVKNDLPAAVAAVTRASLAMQGFDVNNADPQAEYRVLIDELQYDVPASTVMSQVDLKARVRVEVVAGQQRYQGQYKTETQRKVFGNPSPEKIQQLINELLTDTLARSYQDQKLKAFMSNL